MSLTPRLDLRGGQPCWTDADWPQVASDPLPSSVVDVAIVGAGIMGASLAARLAEGGVNVALLDRRTPGSGATAASTALVMWAADTPLLHLGQRLGPLEAARRWRRTHMAVRQLSETISREGLDCGWAPRPEVYLSGGLLGPDELLTEGGARQAAGLPSKFHEAGEIAERFGVRGRAALVSGDAYEVDPVALTHGLLAAARRRGATLSFPHEVTSFEEGAETVILHLEGGRRLKARQLVLATGYEFLAGQLPAGFTLGSSFAIATAPNTPPAWREHALLWEAASPYLYARATRDGRIIVGGEDEDYVDPQRRDRALPAKAKTLARKASAMFGGEAVEPACAWSATFGSSRDGLPAIGRRAGSERVWIAAGFGGNGVTFAALAASMIASQIAGTTDADAACFDPYRFS